MTENDQPMNACYEVGWLRDSIGVQALSTAGADALAATDLKTSVLGLRSADSLSDAELLECLLSIAAPKDVARTLSERLLSQFDSLGRLLIADPLMLKTTGADDKWTIALLGLARTLAARLAREELHGRPLIDCPEALIKYLRISMAYSRVEQFRVLFLDAALELIADEVQHRGTIDHTPVYPREVARRALALDAAAIIIAHNHPSNNPAPSDGDVEMTLHLLGTLQRLDIQLLDHIIVCRRGYSSLKSLGYL